MGNYKKTDALKEIRETAKKNGLTFKGMNATLNGSQLFMFVDRKTGERVLENCQFWTAYEDCMSGHIDTLNRI